MKVREGDVNHSDPQVTRSGKHEVIPEGKKRLEQRKRFSNAFSGQDDRIDIVLNSERLSWMNRKCSCVIASNAPSGSTSWLSLSPFSSCKPTFHFRLCSPSTLGLSISDRARTMFPLAVHHLYSSRWQTSICFVSNQEKVCVGSPDRKRG
jgi:hypothetical protein